MGKASKIASATIASVTSFFGAVTEVVNTTPRTPPKQLSSYHKYRSEEGNRERSRSRRADTTAKGYRQRGSGQRGAKPAHLDHRYNG